MEHAAANSAQLAQQAERPRRGGPARLQSVGDYAGQLAGEAAQAVRRAGLKPGLERSFGFAPELRGQIVAQEPRAGSELVRNGLVTLYVAAPGSASPGEQAVAEPVASEHSEVEVAARRLVHAEPASDRRGDGPRRRKARRPPGGGRSPLAPPPALRLPTVDRAPEGLTLGALDDGEAEGDRAGEEFVIGADELFGGGASAAARAWRQVYPRRHCGLRSLLLGRSRLVMAALAMLGVSLVVAGAAAVMGHRASPRQPNGGQQHSRVSAPPPSLASVPVRPQLRDTRPPTPRRDVPRRRQRSAPERRRARRGPARRPVEQAAPANREFGPERATAEGGLFSP